MSLKVYEEGLRLIREGRIREFEKLIWECALDLPGPEAREKGEKGAEEKNASPGASWGQGRADLKEGDRHGKHFQEETQTENR